MDRVNSVINKVTELYDDNDLDFINTVSGHHVSSLTADDVDSFFHDVGIVISTMFMDGKDDDAIFLDEFVQLIRERIDV